MNAASAHWLDVLVLVMLVSSIAYGFHQGFLRQVILLVSVYFGTALSLRFHEYLSTLILKVVTGGSPDIARIIAFIVMSVGISAIVARLIYGAYAQAKLPDVALMDNVGGAIVGGLMGIFAIAMVLMLVQFALASSWADGGQIKDLLRQGMANSMLMPVFSSPAPVVRIALTPWLATDQASLLAGD